MSSACAHDWAPRSEYSTVLSQRYECQTCGLWGARTYRKSKLARGIVPYKNVYAPKSDWLYGSGCEVWAVSQVERLDRGDTLGVRGKK